MCETPNLGSQIVNFKFGKIFGVGLELTMPPNLAFGVMVGDALRYASTQFCVTKP